MQIRAILIDDEKSNLENLASLLNTYCSDVTIMEACSSAIEGRQSILKLSPDLVFLDIEMPAGDGFSLLDSLSNISFEIIFVTAHDHYALKAIKCCALDYVLKPIDILELTQAVDKAKAAIRAKKNDPRIHNLIHNRTRPNQNRIALPFHDKIEFVEISKIIRCQAEGNYTKIYIEDENPVIVSQTLKEYDELLSENHFIRSHQSHLVNKDSIKSYIKQDGGYLKLKDGTSIPISRQRKDMILEALKQL